MTQEELHEYMDAYLEGSLTKEERDAFEKRLQTDAAFAEQFELVQSLESLMATEGLFDFTNSIQSLDEEFAKKKTGRIISLGTRRVLALAASILLTGAAALWMFTAQPSSEKLFASNFEAPGQLLLGADFGNVRGEDPQTATPEALQNAQRQFQSGDYAAATATLQSLLSNADASQSAELNYHLGVLQLMQDQPALALTHFQAAGNYNPTGSSWHQALTLIKLDRRDEAVPLLEALAHRPNPYQPDAERLLRRIN